MRPAIALVAAVGRNGAIGRRNATPWRLPGDLRRFRTLTMGRPVLLGRRTWESIGHPLPGRFIVVVSSDPALEVPGGVRTAETPASGLGIAAELAARHGADEVIVGGGAALYGAFIDSADRLEVTEVDLAPAADRFFPPIDPTRWRETARLPQKRQEGDEAAYAFVRYERRHDLDTA